MKKYKGFTLVELLIVIVVMGILASMMMISSRESSSTAKASNIISNLRNFSMAAMALYTDKMDKYVKLPENEADKDLKDAVIDYLHNNGDIPEKDKYKVIRVTEEKDGNKYQVWWAGYILGDNDTRVKEKLTGRTKSANLKGSNDGNPPKDENGHEYDSHSYVWLKIRSSKKNNS